MMPHHDPARDDRRRAPHATRSVWDAAGREWQVWAADCRDVPGARSSHCLIFDCGTTVRRVWSPPDDWVGLSDESLLALANPRTD